MSVSIQLPLTPPSAPLSPFAPLTGRGGTVAPQIDVHATSIPARTFTGDFYFVERRDASLWFAVGDVAGKGLGAAVFMAMIQEQLADLRARCALFDSDPARVATELDALLRSVLPSNRFASAVAGFVDASGTLHVANAGHCPLLIARADGSIEMISSTGPVLGIVPGARWRSTTVHLAKGDTLLAYSDGVIEAAGADGEEFGIERLTAAFATIVRRHADARTIAAAVEREVRCFAGGFGDDLTLVVARMA